MLIFAIAVTVAVKNDVPFTAKVAAGEVVPMPTYPVLVTVRYEPLDEPIVNALVVPRFEASTERRACGEVVPIPRASVVSLKYMDAVSCDTSPFAPAKRSEPGVRPVSVSDGAVIAPFVAIVVVPLCPTAKNPAERLPVVDAFAKVTVPVKVGAFENTSEPQVPVSPVMIAANSAQESKSVLARRPSVEVETHAVVEPFDWRI
jgi:hypothetical protein